MRNIEEEVKIIQINLSYGVKDNKKIRIYRIIIENTCYIFINKLIKTRQYKGFNIDVRRIYYEKIL